MVVTITDTCPCNYPANPWGNRRWCCGDGGTHFDLSTEAFGALAPTKLGVIGIAYREVACPGPTADTGKNVHANQANNIDPNVCKKNGYC